MKTHKTTTKPTLKMKLHHKTTIPNKQLSTMTTMLTRRIGKSKVMKMMIRKNSAIMVMIRMGRIVTGSKMKLTIEKRE